MNEIHLWGVKQNNLKNIEVKIPLGSFTVVCGPSGSGKSSLAFETVFAEGQRRFIESMSNYARQFLNKAPKPDLEGIENIPPAIAIEQKNSVRNSRSTVGTTTEVSDYLRLLFEKVGVAHCPKHHIALKKTSLLEKVHQSIDKLKGQRAYLLILIEKKNRTLDGTKLLGQLLQDGFNRIFVPDSNFGEIYELSECSKKLTAVSKESFYLIVDRFALNPEDEGRILDSLRLAFGADEKYQKNIEPQRKALFLTTGGERYHISDESCCYLCGHIPPKFDAKYFSFNSPVGACPTCKGFGNLLDIDPQKVIPNPNLSISEGALQPFNMPSASADRKQLLSYCKKAKIDIQIPWQELPKSEQEALWKGNQDFFGVRGLFDYLDQLKYKMHVRVFISRYRSAFLCPSCQGSRLREDVKDILIQNQNYNELNAKTIEDLFNFIQDLKLNDHEKEVSLEIYNQLSARLEFLLRVGVHYITLSRETRTLSGGEFQRLVLAKQLGMGLSQTLYVLDEPTIGLHPRDNERLISVLKDLKNLGNTLLIVEHDRDVIFESDYVIEMGPGSGVWGGEVVFAGEKNQFLNSKTSLTAGFLKSKKFVETPRHRPMDLSAHKYKIEIQGASGHNLKNLEVAFPLNRLIVVTGVSGSGKSTLVTQTVYPALSRVLGIEYLEAQPYTGLVGAESIKNVVMIDQMAIGKTARSSPISYMKAFDAIRNLMSGVFESKARGYKPGTFSLNVDGGRCPDCKGTGNEEIDMMFMDNVLITCETCDGKKFLPEILEIQFKNKNIHEILSMTVSEAMNFFAAYPNIWRPLSLLKEVGLDYLQIGQSASSLSGGESQRLKIAKELNSTQQKTTLYILDEPTTGLHFKEIDLLMKVLHKLIDSGNSVIVIEHNLDVIRGADYVIDMGPEAGSKGGQVVAQGTPLEIMDCQKSITGQYLIKNFLI